MNKYELQRQLKSAASIVSQWPYWKRNILVNSSKSTVDVPRKPIIAGDTPSPTPIDSAINHFQMLLKQRGITEVKKKSETLLLAYAEKKVDEAMFSENMKDYEDSLVKATVALLSCLQRLMGNKV